MKGAVSKAPDTRKTALPEHVTGTTAASTFTMPSISRRACIAHALLLTDQEGPRIAHHGLITIDVHGVHVDHVRLPGPRRFLPHHANALAVATKRVLAHLGCRLGLVYNLGCAGDVLASAKNVLAGAEPKDTAAGFASVPRFGRFAWSMSLG